MAIEKIRQLYLGNKQLETLYIGGGILKEAYIGDEMVYGNIEYEDPNNTIGIDPTIWINEIDIPGPYRTDQGDLEVYCQNLYIKLTNLSDNSTEQREWSNEFITSCDIGYSIKCSESCLHTQSFIVKKDIDYKIEIWGSFRFDIDNYWGYEYGSEYNNTSTIYIKMSQVYICETVMDSLLVAPIIENNLPVLYTDWYYDNASRFKKSFYLNINQSSPITTTISQPWGYNSLRVNMVLGNKEVEDIYFSTLEVDIYLDLNTLYPEKFYGEKGSYRYSYIKFNLNQYTDMQIVGINGELKTTSVSFNWYINDYTAEVDYRTGEFNSNVSKTIKIGTAILKFRPTKKGTVYLYFNKQIQITVSGFNLSSQTASDIYLGISPLILEYETYENQTISGNFVVNRNGPNSITFSQDICSNNSMSVNPIELYANTTYRAKLIIPMNNGNLNGTSGSEFFNFRIKLKKVGEANTVYFQNGINIKLFRILGSGSTEKLVNNVYYHIPSSGIDDAFTFNIESKYDNYYVVFSTNGFTDFERWVDLSTVKCFIYDNYSAEQDELYPGNNVGIDTYANFGNINVTKPYFKPQNKSTYEIHVDYYGQIALT